MAKIDLGRVGAVLSPELGDGLVPAAAAVERLGFATIWVTGGPLRDLDQVAAVVRGTGSARIATGILSVDRFSVDVVSQLFTELEPEHAGRLVVGLGGAHGANPRATLHAYLDALVAVPRSRVVMAALGPRMLELARDRASGALPVLVTPAYTEEARVRVGDDTTLAVEQFAVVEPDAARARAIARVPLGFLGRSPSYQANFRRMGFDDVEIETRADRLVDELVAWGDAAAVADRVARHLNAGADHVTINLVTESADAFPVEQWRALAALV